MPTMHRLTNCEPRLKHYWHPVARLDADDARGPWPLLGRTFHRTEVAAIREHLGLVWIAPEHPLAPLPSVVEDADPAFTRLHSPTAVWRAAAGQMADNFCDLGHLPFVHATSFADPNDVVVPAVTTEPTDHGMRADHLHTAKRLHAPGVGARFMQMEFTVPFCVTLRLEYPEEDAVITSAFLHQPLDADNTRLWVLLWRNDVVTPVYPDAPCTSEEAIGFQQRVAEEDRIVVESLGTAGLPLDLQAEVHTRADRPTVELRRALARAFPGSELTASSARQPRLDPSERRSPYVRWRSPAFDR